MEIEKDLILFMRRGQVIATSLDRRSVRRIYPAKRLGESFCTTLIVG